MTPPDSEAEQEIAPTTRRSTSSLDRIWGREVTSHGFAGVPSILIRAQKRIGLSPIQLNIILQLLEYWHDPERKPFPTKRDIADRIGVTQKTIQTNIRALEQAGLVRREYRKTSVGDHTSNMYHLDGLVSRVKALEPDFTRARAERQRIRRKPELPAYKAVEASQ